ncbi:MAG: acyl-CoA dehydratase activase [Syntrophales bacterium]|nr:acyl-CoA dehydratase activase [Syntrophales bacterium]
MKWYAGIDAGSTYVKAVLIDSDKKIHGYKIAPTGVDVRSTAKILLNEICRDGGIYFEDINTIMSTGYSRRQIDVAHENITEIKAHAAGALWTAPEGEKVRTIIDIGGQDSKVIVISEKGEVKSFVMNDKCAAGTGRFLEALARVLELSVVEIGPLSLKSKSPCRINSTCVVFAESEVISLLARGKRPMDIIAGVHRSLAKRISEMARKAGLESDILLAGGGGLNPGLISAFEDELMMDVYVAYNPQLNGAIGAALLAGNSDKPWSEKCA